MKEPHLFEFLIVRYVPHPVRQEFMNIGVILFARDLPEEPARVRFTSNWDRVRRFDLDADIEMLMEMENEFKRMLNEAGESPHDAIQRLQERLSNAIQLHRPALPPSVQFAEVNTRIGESLDEGLASLLSLYVEPEETNARAT